MELNGSSQNESFLESHMKHVSIGGAVESKIKRMLFIWCKFKAWRAIAYLAVEARSTKLPGRPSNSKVPPQMACNNHTFHKEVRTHKVLVILACSYRWMQKKKDMLLYWY